MTSLAKTATASQQVFKTAELFELILLEVDMKTLLLAQRVDSHWQGTMNKSNRLQKKLFFTAAIPEDLYLLRLADPDPDNYTLMVRQSALENATQDKMGVAGISLADYAQSNPFFPRVKHDDPIISGSRVMRHTPAGIELPTFRLPRSAARSVRTHPSWMRMFVTQPPNVSCWMPQRPGGPTAAQQTFVAFGRIDYPKISVEMCGFTMRGKYYWDAVERSSGASQERKAAGEAGDIVRSVDGATVEGDKRMG